jgi:hypothetical protein
VKQLKESLGKNTFLQDIFSPPILTISHFYYIGRFLFIQGCLSWPKNRILCRMLVFSRACTDFLASFLSSRRYWFKNYNEAIQAHYVEEKNRSSVFRTRKKNSITLRGETRKGRKELFVWVN